MEVDPDSSGGFLYESSPLMDTTGNPISSHETGSFPLSPNDTDFFSDEFPLPDTLTGDFSLDAAGDFDFDFSFDDICLPSVNEDFLLNPLVDPGQIPNEQGLMEPRLSTLDAHESEVSNLGHRSSEDSSNRCHNVPIPSDSDHFAAGVLNSHSSESVCCDREFSDPESSQGSGNCGEAKSPYAAGGQKVKSENVRKNVETKRKKEHEEGNGECRNGKFRRSTTTENTDSYVFDATTCEEYKKRARLIRNRESAQLSRQRKKHYVEELEDKLRRMASSVQDLNAKISYYMTENASLRQQLSSGHSGTYQHPPMAPMPYPWVPFTPYVVKSQGSQVPLVPIPRLKPQQPVFKAKNASSKKSEGKVKKVAGVSFLGLMFFLLLVGGLIPMVGDREEHSFGSFYSGNKFYSPLRRSFFAVNDTKHVAGIGLCDGKSDFSNDFLSRRTEFERDHTVEPGMDVENASKPLVASLYVPRNDELVKIDGNLIIHSVLASEKAQSSKSGKEKETGLAISGKVSSAIAISDGRMINGRHPYGYSNPEDHKKALTSSSDDDLRDSLMSSASDGKLQQWFHEDLEGPMLKSGMCTEVFQFEISSKGMISAPSNTNITQQHPRNSTYVKKGKNRRVLEGLPILPGSNRNLTKEDEEHVEMSPQNLTGNNKNHSSMIVSVLVDPRDIDGMMAPKSLSRIVVVVLLDSAKYVAYSCVLPLKVSTTHLVTK